MMRFLSVAVLAVINVLCGAASAGAEVVRVDVKTRADIGATGYEKIVGTVYFSVDPADARNRVIADIGKAPRNAAGRVEFSSDIFILRPKSAGNRALLLDVLNRGGKPALTGFNRGGVNNPSTEADLGDRFLLRQGYLLSDDVTRVMQRAGDTWDLVVRTSHSQQ